MTQNTRLPGFFNHKRVEPHLVTIDYRNVDVCYGPGDFPSVRKPTNGPNRGSARFLDHRSSSRRAGKAVLVLGSPPLLVSTATSTRSASAAGSFEFALNDDQALQC